jgi:ribosomal protein S18 acetylase RimI-like enzyme
LAEFAPVVPLTPTHDATTFDCGSAAQTEWLRRHALQAQSAGTSRVYVTTAPGSQVVLGYYALAAGSVEPAEASGRLRKGIGRHPIPVVLLTRLGVDIQVQGRGLGAALMRDALLRVSAAADVIGVRALLVHAESDRARSFYEHIAEFEPSPTDPLHLILLMKDLRRALA